MGIGLFPVAMLITGAPLPSVAAICAAVDAPPAVPAATAVSPAAKAEAARPDD